MGARVGVAVLATVSVEIQRLTCDEHGRAVFERVDMIDDDTLSPRPALLGWLERHDPAAGTYTARTPDGRYTVAAYDPANEYKRLRMLALARAEAVRLPPGHPLRAAIHDVTEARTRAGLVDALDETIALVDELRAQGRK